MRTASARPRALAPAARQYDILFGILFLAALALAVAGLPAAAQEAGRQMAQEAAIPPLDSPVVFDVLRDGSKVGEHRLVFEAQDDDTLKVSVETALSVKFAFLTLFHYEHKRVERWRGGELESLAGITNDDGREYEISIVRKEGHYSRTVNGAEEELEGPVKVDSLWSRDRLTAGKLFSTATDGVYRVRSDALGWETIEVPGGTVEAEHVKLTGEIDRDLWYGPDGALLKLRYETQQGETFEYVRR
ncbi:MAG: hypothetical protein Kow00114_07350 [Kiloniellaceae bacterium]